MNHHTGTPHQTTTGLILAGGRATRMQGRDKGLEIYQGKPLIQHVTERIAPQVDALWISCNRNAEEYGAFACRLLSDARPGFQGPLSGIATALSQLKTPWMLVVPCDTPHLPAHLHAALRAVAQNHQAPGAFAHDGQHGQVLCLLLAVELAPDLERFIDQGGRSARQWIERLRLPSADFSATPEAFANFNTPEDLTLIAS